MDGPLTAFLCAARHICVGDGGLMVRCTWCDGPVRPAAALHEGRGAWCVGCQWWSRGGRKEEWTMRGPHLPPTPR